MREDRNLARLSIRDFFALPLDSEGYHQLVLSPEKPASKH
jgi:hypothetical protein